MRRALPMVAALVLAACGGGAGAADHADLPVTTPAPVVTTAAPEPTVATTATASMEPVPTTTVAPATTLPGEVWEDLGTPYAGGTPTDVAEAPWGWVAAGTTGDDPLGLFVATSPDGSTWTTAVDLPPDPGLTGLWQASITVDGDEVWVWTPLGVAHTPDGTTWDTRPAVGGMAPPETPPRGGSHAYRASPVSDAVVVPEGLVGVSHGQWFRAYDTGDATPARWTSPDGVTWDGAPLRPPPGQREPDATPWYLTDLELVDGVPTVLTQPGTLLAGDTRTDLPLPEGTASRYDLYLVDLVPGPAGPIAVGTAAGALTVWHRDAAGVWSVVHTAPDTGLPPVGGAATDGGYVVARGGELWRSVDGVAWSLAPEAVPLTTTFVGAVGDRVVLVFDDLLLATP